MLWLYRPVSSDERETQQAEAVELLRLSDSLDHREASIQIFLARVELELGQLKRALARTKRLRAAGESSDELDQLWDEAQKAVAEAFRVLENLGGGDLDASCL